MKRSFWWKVVVNAAGLYLIATYLVRSVQIDGPLAVIVAGLILGVVNALIRPVFFILSLPFTLLTIGLFTFIVNGFMLKVTDWLVPGFQIPGFWTAVWVSMLMSLFSTIVNSLVGDNSRRY